MKQNTKKRVKEFACVILLFIILSLVMTYPVISKINTHIAGDGGDGLQFTWNLWHVNQVIVNGGGIQELYYTNYQFYPKGTTLTFHTLSLTNTLFLGFPLMLLTNNFILIYNLLFLFNFILAGFGMYILIKYLTKDRVISFLVGFAFAFSPFIVARGMGHLNLMSIGWVPLFFLFFIKTLKENKNSNPIFAAIILTFLSLADFYHLLNIFIISLLYFLYALYKKSIIFNKKLIQRAIIFVVLFGLLISPFLAPMIKEFSQNGQSYLISNERISCIHPYNYVIPSMFHPVWGNFIHNKFVKCNACEDNVFLGYFIIILSLLYFIKTRKQKFWWALAGLFFIFSIFPKNPLLELLIKIIPFYSTMFVTSRFAFGVLFSIFIIFAFALKDFIPKAEIFLTRKLKLKRKISKLILFSIIFIILFLEFVPVPYATMYGNSKEFNEISLNLKENTTNWTILNLPPLSNSKDLLFQIFHNQKIVGGYISRMSPKITKTPNEIQDSIYKKNLEIFNNLLRKNNVKYITISGFNENEDYYKKLDYLLKEISAKEIQKVENFFIIYELDLKAE
jgi:hypothetical protein